MRDPPPKREIVQIECSRCRRTEPIYVGERLPRGWKRVCDDIVCRLCLRKKKKDPKFTD